MVTERFLEKKAKRKSKEEVAGIIGAHRIEMFRPVLLQRPNHILRWKRRGQWASSVLLSIVEDFGIIHFSWKNKSCLDTEAWVFLGIGISLHPFDLGYVQR